MRPTLDTDFFSLALPRAIGHRGCAGSYPENTLVSFQAAVEAGAPYLELDIHTSRDGKVVVSHDGELERTCARRGHIRELDWADIASADAGFTFSPDGKSFPFRGKGIRIPLLREVLSAFAATRFVIEVKQTEPSVVPMLLKVLDETRMRRMVLVASEHQAPIDEVRALAPEIPTNFPYQEVAGFLQAVASRSADYRPPGDALQIPPEYESWRLVSPETVEAAHRFGVEMHVWTVNEESEMRELLGLGVDGILSDFPARLLKVIREMSRR
jgi:glycerophosphoryl diester phosphodiesterase